jgi:two-component system phosphate regulon sensor histidine kinase PhoR
MYIETLEMGRVKSADKVKEYYGVIGNETRRLTEMVNRILGFSKMEKGKHSYHSAVCDFNAIVESVLTTYHLRLEEQGFDLQYTPTVGLPAILCDKEAVAQALINLVDNAMKYSRESKVIEISTGRYKQWVYLQVKDHGPGIARKHQKLVFDKFYRVTNRNLAHEVKGTGLGLAIVREIMQAHKGRVTLQSRPGEGCAFRLYFTAVKDSVKA